MKPPIESKLRTADEVVELIRDGTTLASGGFGGSIHAETLTRALERRFLSTGSPRGLTLTYSASQGDAKTRGLNHLAHEGLLKRIIGGHWGLAPQLGKMALEGKVEAYNFPQGVMCQLWRDIAAGRPGCITHVGLGTFIDPANEGGRVNANTPPGLVERVEIAGKTWLCYRAFPLNFGFLRASAADPLGNLVMDDEVMVGEVLALAMAVHNCGGTVVAQVRRLLDHPAPPHTVRVPGVLVDHVVLADAGDHDQSFGQPFNPGFFEAGELSEEEGAGQRMPMDERRVIACRVCDELKPGAIANLGIGMPEGVAKIAAERGLIERVTLTIESGPIGGVPASGLSFGASYHPQAIIDEPSQFDFYDGGGLDFAALGAAEIDVEGNVNVSKFGSHFPGVGGFVNITQTAKRLVFCGTFMAGHAEVAAGGGKLRIVREGTVRKFVARVGQLSFDAAGARRAGREVLYVTERAVFRLAPDAPGIELIEVAPGIELERDVLAHMGFKPLIRGIRPMPASCFQ